MRFLACVTCFLLLLFSSSSLAYVYISGINANGHFIVKWTNTSYNSCYLPLTPGSGEPRLTYIDAYTIEERLNGALVEQHIIRAGGTSTYNPPQSLSFSSKEAGQYTFKLTVTNCSSSGQTSYDAGTANLTLTIVNQSRSGKPVIFIHTDMLGSPVAETDEHGDIIQ